VGTEQLAFAVAGLFVVGVLVGIVAAAGSAISDALKGDYGMIPPFAVFAALGGALALVFLGSIPGFTEAILLLISIYLVGQFGLPLLDKKSRQSWRRYTMRLRAIERLEARISKREGQSEMTAATQVAVGFALILLPIAYLAGQARALTQETFLTCDQPRSQIVLRIYGDVMIGLGFDEKTRTVESETLVRKLSTSDWTTMRTAPLGPLKGLPVSTQQKQ
jgi:hypothetical protein